VAGNIEYKKLINDAIEARRLAYCPYSDFAVGAALLAKNGQIFTGCNVENSCGTSNCAERTAFFKAVSEGVREFEAIAIVGGPVNKDLGDFCYPCGICRQVMAEFCDSEFEVICARGENEYEIHLLRELLPFAFDM